MDEIGTIEYEVKSTIGKLLCKILNNHVKGRCGRCSRCLKLLTPADNKPLDSDTKSSGV